VLVDEDDASVGAVVVSVVVFDFPFISSIKVNRIIFYNLSIYLGNVRFGTFNKRMNIDAFLVVWRDDLLLIFINILSLSSLIFSI